MRHFDKYNEEEEEDDDDDDPKVRFASAGIHRLLNLLQKRNGETINKYTDISRKCYVLWNMKRRPI